MIYSYSSLKMYQTCPAQWDAVYRRKAVRREESPALAKGIRIHAQLEEAVLKGTPAPVWTPPGLMATLQDNTVVVEAEYAITFDMTPCGFWDEAAWLRGKVDVAMVRGPKAIVLDWKTGQVRVDPLQADVYATLLRAAHGSTLAITFSFIFVEQAQTVTLKPDSGAEERVRAIIDTIEADEVFEPTPCWACYYCPVVSCEHQGKRR